MLRSLRARLRPHGRASKKLAAAWLFSRLGGWSKAAYQCGNCKAKKLHEQRNCSKFFPLVEEKTGRASWLPVIEHGDKKRPIKAFALSECPTSYITPESVWILEQMSMNALTSDAGVTLFGPDLGQHPAWWADARAAVSRVERHYESELHELMNPNRK